MSRPLEPAPARHRPHRRVRHGGVLQAVRLLAVAALAVSAAVHGILAGQYGAGLPGLTLGKQFVVQAALTALIAAALLVRDAPVVWLCGALVMAGTLGAILLAHTGGGLPQIGPLPGLREEGYDAQQVLTMVAEAAYLLLAALRLALGRSERTRAPGAAVDTGTSSS